MSSLTLSIAFKSASYVEKGVIVKENSSSAREPGEAREIESIKLSSNTDTSKMTFDKPR